MREYLSRTEKLEVRRIIKEKTGYFIKSTSILNQIFRRSSFAAETGQNSNEIFEFIGDEVLSFYVVKIVSKRCGALNVSYDYTFRIRENRFTQIKQALVNNETLAKIINEWDIAKYLFLSKSDIKNNVDKEPKVKADLFEAIIGAIAVECNWDSEILENSVSKALDIDKKIKDLIDIEITPLNIDIDNAVTVLKELAEKGQCTMPEYKFAGPDDTGYDSDGNPKWICICRTINSKTGLTKFVESGSKKDVKKAAAYLILCEHMQIQNKYGPNGWYSGEWVYENSKLFPKNQSN